MAWHFSPIDAAGYETCGRTELIFVDQSFRCVDELFVLNGTIHKYGCYASQAVNLALTATASASSQSGNSRKPVMANDGKIDTRWEASNSSKNSWLRLTLANPASVQQIVLKEYGSKVKAFRIEYQEGSQWLTAATGTSIGSQKLIMFSPVNTGSVRVVFTDLTGQPSISEFEAY